MRTVEQLEALLADTTRELEAARERIAALEAPPTERFYRKVVELGLDTVVIVDADGRSRYASPAFERNTGYRVEDTVGEPVLDAIHPEDRAAVAAIVADLVTAGPGAITRARFRREHAGGTWIHMEAVALNLLDDPDVRGILVSSRDVTLQVETERALRETELRYALATRAAKSGLFERDLRHEEIVWSPPMLELLGYSEHQVPFDYRALSALIHPDDLPMVEASLRGHIEHRTPYDVEFRFRTGTGEYMWFHVVGEARRDANGKATRIIGFLSQVHARKVAEIALRDSERLFRALFEGTSVAVTLRDIDDGMRLLDCNQAALDLYGCASREELVGMLPSDFAPPFQPDGRASVVAFREMVARGVREGTMREEWTSRRKNGDAFLADVRATVIHLENRRVLQAALDDITERKRGEMLRAEAEAAMALAKEAAVAASLTKTAFLANMSHELRTPLNGVIGMVDLLAASDLDERQRRLAQVAASSAHLLLSVIDDILDFAKIEAGKLRLEERDLDLCALVEEVAAVFAATAEQKHIDLRCAYDGPSARLVGAPRRIRQVLANLIGNAVKFTRQGKVSVHARAQIDGASAAVRVEVRDSGIGIAPAAQPLLFQPFSQLGAPHTREFGGTGLGLAISRELIERMGGEIGASSEGEGHGSTFWFTLPLKVAVGAAPAPKPREVGTTPLPRQRAAEREVTRPALGASILVVEDSPASAEVACEILRIAGFIVELATNGALAIESTLRNPPDLILMDCQLPVLDGYAAAQRIRELETHGRVPGRSERIPIVALTADTDPSEVERCLSAGMDDHLAKPVDGAQLLAMIEAHLGFGPRTRAERAARATARPLVADLASALRRWQGRRALLHRVIDQFIEGAPAARAASRGAVERNDAGQVAFISHRLRGQASSFDAAPTVGRIADIEGAARRGEWAAASAGLSAFDLELDRLVAYLAAERQR